jgi:hypothetical protein
MNLFLLRLKKQMPVLTRSQAKKNKIAVNDLSKKSKHLPKGETNSSNNEIIEVYQDCNDLNINTHIVSLITTICRQMNYYTAKCCEMDNVDICYLNNEYKVNTHLHCLLLLLNQYDTNSCRQIVKTMPNLLMMNETLYKFDICEFIINCYNRCNMYLYTEHPFPLIEDTILFKRFTNYNKRLMKLSLKVIRKLNIKYERQTDGSIQIIQ